MAREEWFNNRDGDRGHASSIETLSTILTGLKLHTSTYIRNIKADRQRHPSSTNRHLDQRLSPQAAQIIDLRDEVYRRVAALNDLKGDQLGLEESLRSGHPSPPSGLQFPDTPIYMGSKRVHLGVIDRYLVVQTAPPLTQDFYLRLIPIFDEKDGLIRENHGASLGYHYHYCKPSGDRSDVVMSFEERHAEIPVPLAWEHHGENKAKFRAKPWKWGMQKRESIYAACSGDLEDLRTHFKRPSDEADIVWPQPGDIQPGSTPPFVPFRPKLP